MFYLCRKIFSAALQMENAGITDEFCRFEPRLTDLNYFISSMYVCSYSQTFTKKCNDAQYHVYSQLS